MMDKKRRTLERFKTALIILLTLSALVLAVRSPLVQNAGLPFLFNQGLSDNVSAGPQNQPLSAAAVPVRMAVGTSISRYGVQYDQDAVDALFERTASLLGEALSSAGPPSSLTESAWQALLSGKVVYFGYLSPIPLSVLTDWLTGGDAPSTLTSPARHIVLAAGSDGSLTLSYQGADGGFYQCVTNLDASLHLEPIITSVNPNSAFFAFESSTLPDAVDPYTLFTEEEVSALVYDSVNPLSLSDGGQVSSLLAALSFSDQNQAPVSDGYTFVDGEDTLRMLQGGTVIYHASGQGKYTAQSGLSGAVEAAWALAQAAVPLAGQARLYLISAQEDTGPEEHYTVTFGYCLNGSAVQLYDEGWCAVFEVEDGVVTDFTIRLRSYSATTQQALLLPAERAAAALTALTQNPRELTVQYRDTGDGQAQPYWNAL